MGMAATAEGSPWDRSTHHFVGAHYAVFDARGLAVCGHVSFGRQTLLADSKHDVCCGNCYFAAVANAASVEAYSVGDSFERATKQEFFVWAVLRISFVRLDARMLALCAPKTISIWILRRHCLRAEALSPALSCIFSAQERS